MERTRRTVLASLGTLLSAGCLGQDTPGGRQTETTTTTVDDTTATTATGTGEVTVSDLAVTPQYVARDSPDSIGTYGARNEQFVVATVSAAGDGAPDREEFALAAGEETFDHAEGVGGMGGHLWDRGEPYGEASEGWLAFAVPTPLDVGSAATTWPGGEHTLDDDALGRLRRPPTDFEAREFTAPDSVRLDEDATLTLTIENTGAADGTFVGALNRSGPSVAYAPETAVRLAVSAGETATWRYTNTPDDRYGERAETMTFRLQWGDESLSRAVAVTADDARD